MKVIKRSGEKVEYNSDKVINAIKNAMDSVGFDRYASANMVERNISLMLKNNEKTLTVEEISDEVEKQLMNLGLYDVAKEFIVYRYKRAEDRIIENKRLFIDEYKNAKNASTGSKFDANANVETKNISTLSGELHKRENILLNRKLLTNKISELFGDDLAKEYIRQLKAHELYKHDETSIMPYCVAVNMYPFLTTGLEKLGGHSNPPKNLQSFNGSFINLVFAIASQFAGAVATPEYLMYMDYFVRKEFGEDYYLYKDKQVVLSNRGRTIEKVIDDSFQQVVYSLNQPAAARSYQSIFWNIGYFDKYYFESIFGDFVFPDYTKPNWESLDWLQRHFMEWFNQERLKKPLTFPVETFAMLVENGDVKDKEYGDFVAEMYSKGHSFFTYMSESADSLSSCCFDGEQKVLTKSSNGVSLMKFKDFHNADYHSCKRNLTIFHNGSWAKGKSIEVESNELYEIKTSNNKVFRVTKDHLNPTIRGDIETKDLTTDDYLMFSCRELDTFPEKDLKLTYEQGVLIGAYLGDGSIYQKEETYTPAINYSLNESKFNILFPILKKSLEQLNIDAEVKLNAEYNNVYPVVIYSHDLKDFIKTWTSGKYAYDKELNVDCLLQSIEFRKGILDGYYMTDGGNSNRIYTTSEKMAEQLELLITSLGKHSIIDISDRTDEPVIIRGEEYTRNYPLYCVRWYNPMNKRSSKDVFKVINNSVYFKINSIEKVDNPSNKVYCFVMDREEEPYFTLPNGLITHNCRLRNEISENEFSFSLGAGGVATGSKSVMTLNVNRLVQDTCSKFCLENMSLEEKMAVISESVREQVLKIHKYQIAYNEIMKDNFEAGLLPVYDSGFISLNKQFLTIGINGAVEGAEYLGINISVNEEYKTYIEGILKPIYEENKKARTKEIMFNTEFVPAENLGVKHADWDREDGYFVPRDVYNSYFYIVEDNNTNLIDKFILHGKESVRYLDGRI